MLINGSAVNTVAVNSYSQSTEYVVGVASYEVGTKGVVTAAVYTGVVVPSSYQFTSAGNNRLESSVSGSSGFNYVATGQVAPYASVVGSSNYNVGTDGRTTAIAVAGPGTVSYVVSTDGRVTPARIVEGIGSYSVDSYGRSNVVKYSQEVLEEFACVTYNVSMINNEFVVEPVENSIEVNICY